MRFLYSIFFIFCVVISSQLHSQVITDNKSIVQSALLIDSLENNITDENNYNNANIAFDLSLLYKQIDLSQSKKFGLKYIGFNDSISPIVKRNIIYSLLADIYKKQDNIDSSYFYLSLQAKIINAAFEEENDIVISEYFGNNDPKDKNNNVLGLSLIKTTTLFILFIIIIFLLLYYLHQIKQSNKIKTAKNKELETANTKLKEFNEIVNQKVTDNTNEIAITLKKSNNTIIELRKSLKKAEESNYLKNTFLGSMSHQIRTPLSGIMGFSDMLETELAVMGNVELFDYAKNIGESGTKLMSLITNIFDISSIEANILEIKPTSCSINEIITSLEKKCLFRAKEKGIIFKSKLASGIPNIVADISSLKKVLNIIIDNAFLYTTKGFVTISSINNSNNTVTIRIADKGKGISKETLNNILDSFDHEKHGSLLTYQNSGLGLILAHRLTGLMNGKLKITSVINEGTEVSIILPCVVEKQNESTSHTQKTSIINAPKFGRVKIFIVEDDRMNRLVLEKMLKKSGEIVTAVDGDDTIKKISKSVLSNNIFDIMLFDINLPHPWDGIKLMHEIKKQFPIYKNVPFIAQTAYAMAYDKDTYIDAGFNDYIAKPINKTELLTMIQKQLELHSKKNE